MPDFDLTVGASAQPWTDPGAPYKRLNPRAGTDGMLRYRSFVGYPLIIAASVNGVQSPLDSALGGRLFNAFIWERPDPPSGLTSPAGQSSVQQFTPVVAGHYLIGMRRDGGGSIFVHVDVEAP